MITLDEYDKRLEYLRGFGHQMFKVVFKKRSDGSIRTMICRMGVKKGVKGVQPNRREQDRRNKVVTVYEMNGKDSGFKCIPLDSVIEIQGN